MTKWNEFSSTQVVRLAGSLVLVAGLVACSGSLVAQTTVPDAQVEANVLKALAGAPELANEPIQTKTVYGTVTLNGSVSNESLRAKAETLASTAPGVKKVVDRLTLGDGAVAAVDPARGNPQAGGVLQSDGTYAPATADNAPNPAAGVMNPVMNNPDADQAPYQQPAANGQAPAPQAQANGGQPGYPPQQGYPQQQGYPAPPPGYRQQGYPPQQGYAQSPYATQVAGKAVTIPNGAPLSVRINERLSSNHAQPGDQFDGIVVNDVYAGGAIAIPRGATVKGKVISSTKSGSLKGRGEMSIQLTDLMLGGKDYPLPSSVWEHAGPDKSLETVNRTVGMGAFGALVGAVAGGGEGAAIGAGVGAAAGLGSSAASGRGQVLIPAEAVVAFHLTAPTTVTTVSGQEMQRLAYGVPYGAPGMYRRYPYGYPPPPPSYYPPAYPY